jgi:hypothetical protein
MDTINKLIEVFAEMLVEKLISNEAFVAKIAEKTNARLSSGLQSQIDLAVQDALSDQVDTAVDNYDFSDAVAQYMRHNEISANEIRGFAEAAVDAVRNAL